MKSERNRMDVNKEMKSTDSNTHAANARGLLRRYWLYGLIAVLVVSVSTWSAPAWAGPVAAPLNQTVPRATPTAAFDAVVPTATPQPAESEDEGSSQPGQGSSNNGIDDDPNFDPDSVPFQMPQSEPEGDAGGQGAAVAQAADTLTAVVSVGTLNVREGPGTGFPILGVFNAGQVVTVEARNPENTWWYVCCLPNTETRGWVSAPLLQSNFDRNQSAELIPVFGAAPGATPEPVPTATRAAVAATLPMSLTIGHTPSYVWQGKTFDINLTVTNPNDNALRNLEISDELPEGLRFVAAQGEGAPTILERTTQNGNVLILIRWPVIPADAIVAARITVTVDPELPDGAVLDNLAAARAANGQYTTAGMSIGLPPAGIPDFQ